MATIPVDKFNLNRFWEKTPTALKYVLIFAIVLITAYFLFSKRMDDNYLGELEQMKVGISATYALIDNFDEFRREQDSYNKEVLKYLSNLHALVEDLNATTNRKLDMILSAGGKNSQNIIEKILLLNESFERLSKAYQPDITKPNLDDNKVNKNYQYDHRIIPAGGKGKELKSNETKYSIQVRKLNPDTIKK